ncbi:hypothetical protein [Candidatus Methanomassiliicoccus intestinalis]|jgi:hypothetical protein|uniref:hypothetical protein n=1 Tax=Candidatus Methanomassiliicoccus intestinalis TaxID=1406512 RepID=UPI0037DC9E60
MVKTKRKSIISKSKSSSKPKLKQNERKLSAKDQNALAKISSKEKEARKKYGGKHPAKLRDDKYTDRALIDGDITIYLDTSAVPDVRISVYEGATKRSGGKHEVKRAAKTGVWRRHTQ